MTSEIDHLIQRFVSGAETSLVAANAIEMALDDAFPDDDHVQQAVEMLAMYRPEGGEFLFDTAAIKQRLAETARYLKAQGTTGFRKAAGPAERPQSGRIAD